MDNKTEYFVLQPDGKIGWIENDGCKLHGNLSCQMCADWSLQSAISNAIEVSNQKEVLVALARWNEWDDWYRSEEGVQGYMTVGATYPLQCHVEKKEFCASDVCDTDGQCEHCREPKTLALVTFPSSSGVEETQNQPITINDLQSVKNLLNIKQPLREIKVVENSVLPDNMMVVSSKIFQLIKKVTP